MLKQLFNRPTLPSLPHSLPHILPHPSVPHRASDLFDVKLPYDAPVCSLCRSVGWMVSWFVGVGLPVIIS